MTPSSIGSAALLALLLLGASETFGQTAPSGGASQRDRVTRSRALIATRNHSAAIIELESLIKTSKDNNVLATARALLMQCYFERGDYGSAEQLMSELFDRAKSGNSIAQEQFFKVSGQIVKGTREHVERFRGLGLDPSDRNLPDESRSEVERIRELLEKTAGQTRTFISGGEQGSAAMSAYEALVAARGLIARDAYDSNRWKEELADAREEMTNGGNAVYDAVETGSPNPTAIASNNGPAVLGSASAASGPSEKTVEPRTPSLTTSSAVVNETAKPSTVSENPPSESSTQRTPSSVAPPAVAVPANAVRERRVGVTSPKASETIVEEQVIGSLINYAVLKAPVSYPQQARQLGVSGIVRVDLLVDEKGNVTSVTKLTGPPQLQNAAKDAALRWKFKPFTRDGKPVRASGFINFQFAR